MTDSIDALAKRVREAAEGALRGVEGFEFIHATSPDNVRRLMARMEQQRLALKRADDWFTKAAPGDSGCEFLNEGGWDDALPLHAEIRDALAEPQPAREGAVDE